jgi:adiponectin receptor
MELILDSMTEHIDKLKSIVNSSKVLETIDSPDFNWLDSIPFVSEKGMVVYYTPRWPLMIHYLGAICCFGASTIYHLFNAHSKKMMSFWIRFDYAGICCMIAGSSTPPLYYSFACDDLI